MAAKKTKPRAKAPRKRTIRQTSNEVSSAAARMAAVFRETKMPDALLDSCTIMNVTLRELRSMAFSLVNQDQTKGKRGRKAGR